MCVWFLLCVGAAPARRVPGPHRTTLQVDTRMDVAGGVDDLRALGLTALGSKVALDIAGQVVGRLLDMAGRPFGLYPFGNPVSAETWHVGVVADTAYALAHKTDGVRAALCLGTVRGMRVAVAMDREGTLFDLPGTQAPSYVWDGTLVDCELLGAPGAVQCVGFDAALLAGLRCASESLTERLQSMRMLLEQVTMPGVALQVKRMVPLVPGARDRLGPSPWPSDGFILTPEHHAPPGPGTAEHIIKVKEVHSLDVLWTDGGPSSLWFGDGAGTVALSTLRPEVQVLDMPPATAVAAGPIIVELAVVSVQKHKLELRYLRTRPGKSVPNNARCVRRTLLSAQDPVSLRTLEMSSAPASAAVVLP